MKGQQFLVQYQAELSRALLTYAFSCNIAHSLIKGTVSNLNWQQQLIIAFVSGASVLSGLRIKVNGLYRKKNLISYIKN